MNDYELVIDPQTSIKTLIKLSKYKNWYIRLRVANNPNTPLEVLIELCKDENESVKDCAKLFRINRMGLLK